MANTRDVSATGHMVFRLDTTGVMNIGEAAEGVTGSWLLQVIGTGDIGSLVLCKKLRRTAGVADADAAPTYYENFADGTAVAANTAIAAAGLFRVPSDACDVIFDYTAGAGAMVIHAVPQLG